MQLDVVGLSGKIGTGKDYIAEHYFFPLGYRQFSLAWHFKVWIVGKEEASYEEVFQTKPPFIRDLLQKTGTEEGRMVYGQNVWVETMFTWMKVLSEYWNVNQYIVPDVRFPNEVEAIQRHGGRVFRILASSRNEASKASPEARSHPSETALDEYPLDQFDGIIFNDPAYTSTVDKQLSILLSRTARTVRP